MNIYKNVCEIKLIHPVHIVGRWRTGRGRRCLVSLQVIHKFLQAFNLSLLCVLVLLESRHLSTQGGVLPLHLRYPGSLPAGRSQLIRAVVIRHGGAEPENSSSRSDPSSSLQECLALVLKGRRGAGLGGPLGEDLPGPRLNKKSCKVTLINDGSNKYE